VKIPKFNSNEEAYNWIENQRFADMNQTDFNNISKLAFKTPKSDFMKFVLENNDKIFFLEGGGCTTTKFLTGMITTKFIINK